MERIIKTMEKRTAREVVEINVNEIRLFIDVNNSSDYSDDLLKAISELIEKVAGSYSLTAECFVLIDEKIYYARDEEGVIDVLYGDYDDYDSWYYKVKEVSEFLEDVGSCVFKEVMVESFTFMTNDSVEEIINKIIIDSGYDYLYRFDTKVVFIED